MAVDVAILDDDGAELEMGIGDGAEQAATPTAPAEDTHARPGARLIASTRRRAAAAPRQGMLRTKHRRAGGDGRAGQGAAAGPSGGALTGRAPDRPDVTGIAKGGGAGRGPAQDAQGGRQTRDGRRGPLATGIAEAGGSAGRAQVRPIAELSQPEDSGKELVVLSLFDGMGMAWQA
eukprot:13127462-Alexandrium_andersonii.AAC.1